MDNKERRHKLICALTIETGADYRETSNWLIGRWTPADSTPQREWLRRFRQYLAGRRRAEETRLDRQWEAARRTGHADIRPVC